ncbi:MAG: VOC family protein [Devosia sp.]|uniref:VOC family protein n=1 Tax=Devosia sp. 66-22 TaxID=1895753 RepID=UPI00092C0EEF|nr:VOC family protein [Devosia sp. 66-22]MBN9345154.1 VOC family protein [Devosia sp.]OJX48824.1 MAG: bleomycin resistance protein [Devosia sp. 66-22]
MARYEIDYFEIPAADAGKTSAFFTAAFGFAALAYGPDYIEVREAGVLGGVNGDAGDRPAAPLIGIRTDDIAVTERAIVAAGGTITKPAYPFPGGRRLFFREPGGAELLVYQPND